MLTSGTQCGTSSFPTSLAGYLEPTTSGFGTEVNLGKVMPITLRSHLSFSLAGVGLS